MKRFSASGMTAILLASSSSLWAQTQYTQGGDPTPGEQHALELINRARANPTAEGSRLNISPISEGFTAAEAADVGPRPPLAMNSILLQIARAHSQDMWTRDYFDHDDLYPGTSAPYHWPWDRADDAGYSWDKFGENIATGSNHDAGELEDVLMIDFNYPGRGHRRTLLDIDPASTSYFREIGVGYYRGAGNKSNIFRDVLTEDFGLRNAVGPFIVGVVYDDTNLNDIYDPGEELPGVTVRFNPAGTFYAVSAPLAGGYSFPYTGTGNITIEATGGAFGAGVVSRTINRTGENVKVDFKLSDLNDTDGDGLPDPWEITHFTNTTSQNGTGDPDTDGANNLAEFAAGTDPMDPMSIPPSAPAKKGGSGGGGCGLTGLEALLALELLRRLRRR